MLTEFDSVHPPEIAYKKIIRQSHYGDLEIISSIKNEQIVLKGKRAYSGAVLGILIVVGLLLFLVGLLIAALYYWTRPHKKIIIEIEPKEQGSTITISSQNKIEAVTIYEIKKLLSP